ncbi:hypothetical protein TNCV_2968151 [Trichonephila clavipes]|nr:hypothetical protein TNCV_2968151 [Trichonephila clavipes]
MRDSFPSLSECNQSSKSASLIPERERHADPSKGQGRRESKEGKEGKGKDPSEGSRGEREDEALNLPGRGG